MERLKFNDIKFITDKDKIEDVLKDLWHDDYVGRAMVSREAGYTIKVTRQ